MDAVRTVIGSLAGLGIHLRPEYVASALQQGSRQGEEPEEQLQWVYAQFLTADMNACGAGCLPADLPQRHNNVLRGRYVLQIDEAIDTAAPAKSRCCSMCIWLACVGCRGCCEPWSSDSGCVPPLQICQCSPGKAVPEAALK